MTPPATSTKCSYCSNVYTGAKSNHTRSCRSYTWDIFHLFAEKKGPMITTTRNKKGDIVCKCVSTQFGVCNDTFVTQSALNKHLNTVKPTYWVVSGFNRTYASPCQPFLKAPNEVAAVVAAQELKRAHPPSTGNTAQEQIQSLAVDPMAVDFEQPANSSAELVCYMLMY